MVLPLPASLGSRTLIGCVERLPVPPPHQCVWLPEEVGKVQLDTCPIGVQALEKDLSIMLSLVSEPVG